MSKEKRPAYFRFFLKACDMISLLDKESTGRVIHAVSDYSAENVKPNGDKPYRGGGFSEDWGGGETVNQRKRAFCEAYLISGNATDAAREARYSPRSARSIGQRLLTFDDVREYLERRNQEISEANTARMEKVRQF